MPNRPGCRPVAAVSSHLAISSAAAALCLLAGAAHADITIAVTPIGYVGNNANTGSPGNPGAVNYPYSIGTYVVTNAQYVACLNAVAASDPNSMFSEIGNSTFIGGIRRSGSPGSFTYSVVAGKADFPVNWLSFWDCCRFANWMQNGQPTGPQGPTTTEDGSYTLTPAAIAANTVTRNARARWAIPTENEWYKAAFYQPASLGGNPNNWWLYPTSSNSIPIPLQQLNSNNYVGNLTPVGSYPPNFFGLYDMAGNVFQWNEAVLSPGNRNYRGCGYDYGSTLSASNVRYFNFPADSKNGGSLGFRLVLLPDPCPLPITIPATTDALALDCDGDMLRDSCATITPTNDCNSNGQLDSCETLVFTNETFAGGPGAWSVNGTALLEGGAVTLTPALVGQGGSIVRPPLTSGVTQRLRAIFDFRAGENGQPGDGISFSLIDAAAFTTGVVFGEEGVGTPGTITVKFNTYQNFPAEGSNSITVKYSGSDVAINTNLPFQIIDGRWHRAVIDLSPTGRVSVKLGTNPGDLTPVLSDIQLPSYTPQRSIIGIGGRTGAAFTRQQIANVRLAVNGPNDVDGNGVPDSCECVGASIGGQPSPQTVCPSAPVTLTVIAAGTPPLSFAWRKGGVPIDPAVNPTAATASLTLGSVGPGEVGSYDCVVLNACGGLASNAAAVSLAPKCSLADVVGSDIGAFRCGDGTVDGSDFVAFINSFAIGDVSIDPIADVAGGGPEGLSPDGTIDGTDFVAFINAFALGC